MGLVKEKSTTVFAYCKESDLMANIDRVIEKAEELVKAANENGGRDNITVTIIEQSETEE